MHSLIAACPQRHGGLAANQTVSATTCGGACVFWVLLCVCFGGRMRSSSSSRIACSSANVSPHRSSNRAARPACSARIASSSSFYHTISWPCQVAEAFQSHTRCSWPHQWQMQSAASIVQRAAFWPRGQAFELGACWVPPVVHTWLWTRSNSSASIGSICLQIPEAGDENACRDI